jgi:hypothetical protein
VDPGAAHARPLMKNAAHPSSARARVVARQTGTYETSVLLARMTRMRCEAGGLGMVLPLVCSIVFGDDLYRQ